MADQEGKSNQIGIGFRERKQPCIGRHKGTRKEKRRGTEKKETKRNDNNGREWKTSSKSKEKMLMFSHTNEEK